VAPGLSQPTPLNPEDLTHDKTKQAERVADKLCFDSSTARWFTESSAAQDYVASHADRIGIPTTWLVGGADPIADPSRSKVVAGRVPGAAYHDLVGMRHEVFNEVDRASVFAELTRALDASA
jgi:alpha-beta hydrolase superfamily lysophospholipase